MSGSRKGRSQRSEDPANYRPRRPIARAAGSRPPLVPAKRRFLDDVEKAIKGIAQPVDNAAIYQMQVQYVLDRAGFYVVREVPFGDMRRIDLVLIRGGITAAVELDKCNPLARSYGKMLDIPEDILRVVVLRRRLKSLNVAWVDRCISVRAHLRMVAALCDGTVGGFDMQSISDMHVSRGELIPLREHLLSPPRTRGTAGSRR
jgi:hypothetical protein